MWQADRHKSSWPPRVKTETTPRSRRGADAGFLCRTSLARWLALAADDKYGMDYDGQEEVPDSIHGRNSGLKQRHTDAVVGTNKPKFDIEDKRAPAGRHSD